MQVNSPVFFTAGQYADEIISTGLLESKILFINYYHFQITLNLEDHS